MGGQDTLHPTGSAWHVVAVLDNVRQLVPSTRVGDGPPDALRLEMVGQQRFERRLAPWMREGALGQQAEEPLTLQALQITPAPPRMEPCVLALLAEGAFPCQDRTQRFRTG